MARYIVQRLLAIVPMAVLLTAAVFALVHVFLGDPVVLMLGREADPETAQRLRHELGLDRPLYVQYGDWLSHAARGDLGRSLRDRVPVAQAIGQRIQVTGELTVLAMVAAFATALVLGTGSAVRAGGVLDFAVSGFCIAGVTLPNFLVGIILIFVFALTLRWLPSGGYAPPFSQPLDNLRLMILPTATLSLAYIGFLSLVLKSSLKVALGAPYVQTGRAKGITERRVLVRHALRNSLIPLLSVLGVEIGRLFGGAVITETIFALPGVGRLLVDSILGRDFPVIQAVVALLTFGVLVVNLCVDLAYGWLDPRVTYE
ncbi:MAG TPA: ABC transporter permease [bacterium]|nr:ABC transporter permease [bacterium]